MYSAVTTRKARKGITATAKTNNGWWKAPTGVSEVRIPELTVAEVLAEWQPKPDAQLRDYDGDLPGRELNDQRMREYITELVEAGWTYWKANSRGKGKPRIVSPGGHTYALANTPSDVRSFLNARADLRRIGRRETKGESV